MLHQEDEPGDLPIKLTGLGVAVAYFGLSCAWLSRGEAKIFSNESLINSSVPRRPPRGFVTSYYPRWGGLRDKPKEPLKAREAVNKGVE